MTMDHTQHSRAYKKALRLIEGGKAIAEACRNNIAAAERILAAANDNVARV